MYIRNIGTCCMVVALAASGTVFGPQQGIAAQPGQDGAQQGVQVLTRGPVHEAFAETVTYDPEPGIVVAKAPPAAIEELPPDQKPAGDNVTWIPGYWAWDDERVDFLWVSGVWRDLPPGRQWVPGYWGKTAQGYQWTSGYWADAKTTAAQYLSEPPATAEAGPNIVAPSADSTWLPGCWIWQQGRYAWRPGFWAAAQPDWDWVPAHYVYAPRGYVFVDGYWDYSVGRRGVLFAPVYLESGVYSQQGFSYSPSIAIDLGMLATHLFLRPQYDHYYFGDYYAANYQAAGFCPSYAYNTSRYGYDPIFAHERWEHRQDGQWEHRVAADFQNRRDHVDARPPRTWAAQRALGLGGAGTRERNVAMAAPFTQGQNGPRRFQPVDQSERRTLAQHGQAVQRFRDERQKLETTAANRTPSSPSQRLGPARVPLPRSPIVARTELGRGHAPPPLHEAPRPDPRVEAKPRMNRSGPQPQQHAVNRRPLETTPPQTQPQPRSERPATQPQPRVERPAPQTQTQPRSERPAAQPQPRVERPAPQARPQPNVGHAAPQAATGPASAGPNQDRKKDKAK